MQWLKRNILLLLGALISIGALAGAIVFLVFQINRDAQYRSQLQQHIQGYEMLIKQQVYPGDENIQLAQAESARLKQFVAGAQPLLVSTNPPPLDSVGFKSLLENTIDELQKAASSSGILLPAKYGFGFQALRPMVTFPTNAIMPLTVQLIEVKEVCNILIQSKVHSIDAIKRVRVIADETSSQPDYLEGRAVLSTAHVTITPYEIAFKGFSAELSAVLDALQRSKIFFVVKKVDVFPTKSVEVGSLPVATTNAPAATPVSQPKSPPKGNKAPPPPAAPAPITILTEQPLKVTLSIEVIKLKQPGS